MTSMDGLFGSEDAEVMAPLPSAAQPQPQQGTTPTPPPAAIGADLPSRSLAMVRPEMPSAFGFPASLPIELASGLTSLADILDAYGLTLAQLTELQASELFKAEYDRAMQVRKEPNGLVKLQAMLMLPQVLESQFKIAQDKDMPPAVRVKAGENIMAIPAELYPKKAAESGPALQSINIVFNAPPAGFTPDVKRGEKPLTGVTIDYGEES